MNIYNAVKSVFRLSFIRFLFVAGLNTCFGYALFALCVFIFKNVYISVIVATVIAILFNFKTYGRIVFNSKDNSKVFLFFGVYLFVMGIQLILLKCLAYFGLTNPYLAGGILTLPLATLSFLLMRKFVFK